MLKLNVPPALQTEFKTISALWESKAETRRVDSLILAWVKYEKQLRRLFCFLVFQHPDITEARVERVINDLANNSKLYPRKFIKAIAKLGATPVPTLIGARHRILRTEVDRIGKYRNKLIHGQITGLKITSSQLEHDVRWIIDWMSSLAAGAQSALGYDGIDRNTFKSAQRAPTVLANYPFSPKTFSTWLSSI